MNPAVRTVRPLHARTPVDRRKAFHSRRSSRPSRATRFEIEAPGGGRLEIWLTTDGHIFMDSQAGLELVLALFIELRGVTADIAIEDAQRGVLHSVESFKEFLCGEDTAEKSLSDIITGENAVA